MRSDQFNWELMRFRLERSEVQMGDEFWENPRQLHFNKATVLSILGLIPELVARGVWRCSCFHEPRMSHV